jgi:hypothetical protein
MCVYALKYPGREKGLPLSQTRKNVILFLFFLFTSTKSENRRVEQVLPSGRREGEEKRDRRVNTG